MKDSVFKIYNNTNGKFGTGFVIKHESNGSYLLTCGHVIQGVENDLYIEKNKVSVIENHYDKGLDLAILHINKSIGKPLPLSIANENYGHTVFGFTTFGNDIKKEPINKIRIKTNIEIEKKKHDRTINQIKLYTEEEISEGYSGSPVICNNTNSVIGIVNIQNGKSVNYAISTTHVNELFNVTVSQQETKTELLEINHLSKEEEFYIEKEIDKSFQESLTCYSTQNNIWVEQKLCSQEESTSISTQKCRGDITDINEIINIPTSLIINSRQQFGLTSLAKSMVQKAWKKEQKSFWLYLDINEFKPNLKNIENIIKNKIRPLNLSLNHIECIIIDEVSPAIDDAQKILKFINDLFIDKPIIIMLSNTDSPISNTSLDFNTIRYFDNKYLWSLSRNDIRKIVNNYNTHSKHIGGDDVVISRLTQDFEFLNIPRTPYNCLTFLKIYEVEFDEAPVNRTEMIRRVLFLLFNIDDIPKYKSKPDLKDVEYVLGYFCETIVRSHDYYFSRDIFLQKINDFCEDSEIDLDTNVIFDVLYANNIIIQRGSYFCFKFTYWVFYFAAHRMFHSNDFEEFILSKLNYTTYPEIIEYYTGIDRKRSNVINILINDLKETRQTVRDKCDIPENFNIYDMMHWKPTSESFDAVKDMLASGAQGSKLPDEIKDGYADKKYDSSRPLTQNVNKILEEYSLLRLMQCTSSAAKALRNSDYTEPKIKHQLLNEILKSWEELIKVLILLAPAMAESRQVIVDGTRFVLTDDFKGSYEDILQILVPVIPSNVVGWYQDDIFSPRMSGLILKNADKHENKLIIHLISLLVISKRPNSWEEYLSDYILSLNKNSYYLLAVLNELRSQYQYSFTNRNNVEKIGRLIKMTLAKHTGIKKIGDKAISKISDENLPERIEQ